MFTFLEAGAQLLQGHEEARQRVSNTLDLSLVDSPDLLRITEQLKGIIDRLKELRQEELPSTEQIKANGDRRYKFFPTTTHDWVWDKLGRAPDG